MAPQDTADVLDSTVDSTGSNPLSDREIFHLELPLMVRHSAKSRMIGIGTPRNHNKIPRPITDPL
jgi:hypothetical protein